MATATLTSKGQITVPKSVRDHLRLVAGDRLEFEVGTDNAMTVRPISGSLDELIGCAGWAGGPAPSLEELDEELTRSLVADDARIRRGAR